MRGFRELLGERVLVADGAMGTMLQGAGASGKDFGGHEGCNEWLSLTRPDLVAGVHEAYLAAGADVVETNTFGANLTALAEYGLTGRLGEIAEAGARLARVAADRFSTPARPRFVLGSLGPGTKLPSLRQVGFVELRDAYETATRAMLIGGVDAVQIETVQDLLQAKAAVIGAKRAARAAGVDLPILVSVTVETTGVMLLGSEIAAAWTSLGGLGVDAIGLNCATGPAEMGEHLRHLSRHADVALEAMPNAGLPQLSADGAVYPLGPAEMADALAEYCSRHGLALVGGCCGTTPEHIAALADRLGGREVARRRAARVPAASSLYVETPFAQDASYLSIGERTNANGSKAFREAMLAGRWDDCVDIAKAQAREGAHLLDVCVDYVGRDGAADMAEIASRLATAVTTPIVLDSTEPAVLAAGLEALAGRCVVNSVNYENGDGPESRFNRVMRLVAEHGAGVVGLTIDEEGQARTVEWKLRVAERLIDELTGAWGMRVEDILLDVLTFPIATGQAETRRDGLATIEAIAELRARHPGVGTVLGVSNVSFGLRPAARVVLNSVFLHECVAAGLGAAIVHAARITPIERIPEQQREAALDLIWDRRSPGHDPLTRFLELFEGVDAADVRRSRAQELAELDLWERLRRRIIDGEAKGLAEDLDEALASKDALAIINEDLLDAMRTVGELFGAGRMQLPFVLSAAEAMKQAVDHLEPHMPRADAAGKGTLVLATVRGDVHDIGKNLVDIIVSNNGYRVVNLGIKQPIQAIIDAAAAADADAIGMSGLLVKSTQVMRENLEELSRRGLARRYPVLLGGAALTRGFVEDDLDSAFDGEVRYARDAFEGLALMDAVMAVKRGEPDAALPAPRKRRTKRVQIAEEPPEASPTRSDVARGGDVPIPPFHGSRVARGIGLREVARWLDERATFVGQWGLKPARDGQSLDELIETEARPRLRMWLERIAAERIAEFAVCHGYWPAHSEGDTLIVGRPDDPSAELTRFTFPRQRRGRRLCLADFFRDREEAAVHGPDVLAAQLVTMGPKVARATARLFEAGSYREYLELHGLSVQLTEALAELWHHRAREELELGGESDIGAAIRDQAYQGSRYSFGYPACPELADRAKLVTMLAPERIGVTLSETFQLHPEHSTDALIVHHQEAKYFNAR